MTEIINRRTEVDPDDSERMARRRTIRQMAARRDAELAPALMAEADVEASERRCDQAADEHSTATGPLQLELSTLEEAAIKRVADRRPPDPEADGRRAELIAQIGEATAELEAVTTKEREIQSVLRRKARLIRQGHPPPDTILAALAKPPAANPRLLVELFVANRRATLASGRVSAAQTGLRIADRNLSGIRAGELIGELGVYTHKRDCWEAELKAAEAAVVEASAQVQSTYQKVLDE